MKSAQQITIEQINQMTPAFRAAVGDNLFKLRGLNAQLDGLVILLEDAGPWNTTQQDITDTWEALARLCAEVKVDAETHAHVVDTLVRMRGAERLDQIRGMRGAGMGWKAALDVATGATNPETRKYLRRKVYELYDLIDQNGTTTERCFALYC